MKTWNLSCEVFRLPCPQREICFRSTVQQHNISNLIFIPEGNELFFIYHHLGFLIINIQLMAVLHTVLPLNQYIDQASLTYTEL